MSGPCVKLPIIARECPIMLVKFAKVYSDSDKRIRMRHRQDPVFGADIVYIIDNLKDKTLTDL